MGRVIAPFGVKGWFKVDPFSASPGGLTSFSSWWIEGEQGWSEFEVAETAVHGVILVAHLNGCDDRDAAARFRGRQIAVPRAALPVTGENEAYQVDLIGLEVRNLDNQALGSVVGFFDSGAHDVMRVAGSTGERLLPFVPTVVKVVDQDSGYIVVDWGVDW